MKPLSLEPGRLNSGRQPGSGNASLPPPQPLARTCGPVATTSRAPWPLQHASQLPVPVPDEICGPATSSKIPGPVGAGGRVYATGRRHGGWPPATVGRRTASTGSNNPARPSQKADTCSSISSGSVAFAPPGLVSGQGLRTAYRRDSGVLPGNPADVAKPTLRRRSPGPTSRTPFGRAARGKRRSGRDAVSSGRGRSASAPPPSSRGGGGGRPIPLIKACRDLGELEALVDTEAGAWSKARNICALASAYNKAGQLRADTGADSAAQCRVFSTLAAAYLPLVKGLQGGADISIPLHACAKAGYWGGGLAAVLLQRLNSEGWVLLGRSKENELSNLWWSLSEALKSAEGRQVLSSIDLPRLLEASAEGLLAMPVTRTQHCSNVLLACARLRYKNAALTHHLTARLVELGPEAKPQELANSLYALGELAEDVGHTPRPGDLQGLARAVADRLSQDAAAFKPQELSNMLLGCAKLGYTAPSLLHSLVAAAAGAAPRMKPQHLANSLYSLALLQRSISAHGGAAEALAEECKRRRFSGFKPQELSNPAWALATMGYADQGWYAAVAEAAGRPGMMQGGTSQNWSNLWYALALGRHQPASGRLLERTAEAAGTLRQGAKAQHCANLLWALANLRLYDERLVDALAGRLGELLGQDPKQLTGQGLFNSLWALAVMGPDLLSRHSGLVEGLLREAERRWAAEGGRAYTLEALRQLWYAQLELAHVGGGKLQRILGAGEGRGESLLGAARAAAEKAATEESKVSSTERQVASALERLAERLGPGTLVSVQRGCVVPGLGRAADVVVELAGGRRVAVEVDGPWHFLANRPRDPTAVDGPTELRNRQLGREFGAGHVVSVLWWEWEFKSGPEQEELLVGLLKPEETTSNSSKTRKPRVRTTGRRGQGSAAGSGRE